MRALGEECLPQRSERRARSTLHAESRCHRACNSTIVRSLAAASRSGPGLLDLHNEPCKDGLERTMRDQGRPPRRFAAQHQSLPASIA